MRKLVLFMALLSLPFAGFAQKSFETYYQMSDFYQASPGAFKNGLYGFQNPAILNYNTFPFDLSLVVSEKLGEAKDFSRWGLFYGSENLGFGAVTHKLGDKGVTDYRISTGFGGTKFGLGIGYGWSGGDVDFFGRSSLFNFGLLIRPIPQLSIGANYMKSTSNQDDELVGEIAVRPIGTYPLTFYADFSRQNGQEWDNLSWSAGASWEIINGIRVNGRYFKEKNFMVGVDLSTGGTGYSGAAHLDQDGKNGFNTWSIRVGGNDRTIFDDLVVPKFYVKMDLTGTPTYTKFTWFDNSTTLFDILNTIELAKHNKNVQGIVINTAQFDAPRAILWEIREKLADFKSIGKKVVVYLERADHDMYAFATIGDQIIIEEMGAISMTGFMMGRSYYKQMLENIGLGFQEMRYFKYKSAVENFSRESFSEGDREQRQRMIDEWYEITADMITSSRNISKEKYEQLVNNKISYFGKDLIGEKLVDQVGRITEIDSLVKSYDKSIMGVLPAGFLYEEAKPIDDQWAYETTDIALVYAIGACSMEGGINARSLVNDLKAAYANPRIKAIVLRVDSPGGDALASDYIAKVVRDNKNKKPLIVSQGAVAGSGGYWLSMDADVIVSTPMTITGSIGVISGYMYDKGLKDSIGISYDLVKRGRFADLGASYTTPIIPIGFPVRQLTNEESEIMKESIMSLYDEFVAKVANGRKMTTDQVKEVAQGRIWSGRDAKKNGLVDEIGGMFDAIRIAREKAGIPTDKKVNLVQYPKGGFINFSQFMPSLIGVNIDKPKQEIEQLKFLFDMNGRAMPMLPIDYLKID